MSTARSGQGGTEKGQARAKAAQQKERSQAEWASLSLSAAIVLGMAALVVYAHLVRPEQPPVIEVAASLDQTRQANGLHYLPVQVTNSGGQTAEALVVVWTLAGGETTETAHLEVPFLADGETVQGVVTFTRPPAEAELAVTFSYLEP